MPFLVSGWQAQSQYYLLNNINWIKKVSPDAIDIYSYTDSPIQNKENCLHCGTNFGIF